MALYKVKFIQKTQDTKLNCKYFLNFDQVGLMWYSFKENYEKNPTCTNMLKKILISQSC